MNKPEQPHVDFPYDELDRTQPSPSPHQIACDMFGKIMRWAWSINVNNRDDLRTVQLRMIVASIVINPQYAWQDDQPEGKHRGGSNVTLTKLAKLACCTKQNVSRIAKEFRREFPMHTRTGNK